VPERSVMRGVGMEISLPPALKQFVGDKVQEGMYQNESDVICDALRRAMRWNSYRIVTALQSQLADVDNAIKKIMNEIERKRSHENEQMDSIKETQEKAEAILENLRKAADAYTQIINATHLDL
jgi:putative addiction module CopG family antidote